MDDMLTARRPAPFIVQIEWHGPEVGYAAGVVRDGQPWVLGGALLGTGPTPGQATDNLARAARAARPLSLADPRCTPPSRPPAAANPARTPGASTTPPKPASNPRPRRQP